MTRTREISRRSVLRGLGTAIALPWLEALSSPVALAAGAATAPAPLRMAFFYVPNGVHLPAWMPEAVGSSFELPATLEPLAAFKDDLVVLSGLAQQRWLLASATARATMPGRSGAS